MISSFSKIFRQYIINEINVPEDDIVGLVERIYIDGIGEVDAKIDSGNGAYNVIHGEVVRKRGDNIMILEAMKMTNTISTAVSGRVKAINFKNGDHVNRGDVLAVIQQLSLGK